MASIASHELPVESVDDRLRWGRWVPERGILSTKLRIKAQNGELDMRQTLTISEAFIDG